MLNGTKITIRRWAGACLAGAAAGLATLSASALPCDRIDRSLTDAWKAQNLSAITRHVRRDLGVAGTGTNAGPIEIQALFRSGIWAIVRVDPRIADETWLFYRKAPHEGRDFVAAFTGEVKAGEGAAVRKWLRKNVLGLPRELGSCFVWHVTVERQRAKP
ncbi:MAG TPA: hypothetical protein VFV17_03905 [Usitatibacteraceae bacterium]|nr:hypothetical protein [Usitatibacteraceae bacterium]